MLFKIERKEKTSRISWTFYNITIGVASSIIAALILGYIEIDDYLKESKNEIAEISSNEPSMILELPKTKPKFEQKKASWGKGWLYIGRFNGRNNWIKGRISNTKGLSPEEMINKEFVLDYPSPMNIRSLPFIDRGGCAYSEPEYTSKPALPGDRIRIVQVNRVCFDYIWVLVEQIN